MTTLHNTTQALAWLRARACTTLTTDSRRVPAGAAFIAWPGAASDTRLYMADALERGASACLYEPQGAEAGWLERDALAAYPGLQQDMGHVASAFWDHPSEQLAVVAVTGTNGKTSTTWWLAQALSAVAMPCGVIGTLGVGQPGVAAGLESTGFTTPDPVVLQQTLRRFVDQGLRACAMEASSIGIEEQRLNGTRVRVAVLTNFTQDHLDYHGTMAAYWEAKRQLFDWTGLVSAVINIDDAQGRGLADELLGQAKLDVWTVSCQQSARLQARNIQYTGNGLCFDVCEGDAMVRLQSQVIGLYNVQNLLGVVATMRALGITLQAAVQACAALQPVPGRMQCVTQDNAPLVAVDYAHTPDALGQALQALRPLADARAGRLWCVFGCGGDRDPSKRPLMGAIAAQKADHVVVTSDNPRSERPESIISQILLGVANSQALAVQVDRALAIADVVQRAAAQDVILVAGKGHECVQEIAGVKHPFSDVEQVQAALVQRHQLSAGGAA